MVKPFSGVDGITVLNKNLNQIKKDIETYFNALNLMLFSPPGAQVATIPEKPDILIYVEEIQSSGHLLLPGGLLQQPHIFMKEYDMCVAMKRVFDNIAANR